MLNMGVLMGQTGRARTVLGGVEAGGLSRGPRADEVFGERVGEALDPLAALGRGCPDVHDPLFTGRVPNDVCGGASVAVGKARAGR